LLWTGSQLVSKQVKNDIDLVHSKGGLVGFQLANEAQAYTGTNRKLALSHPMQLALMTNKSGKMHIIPFRW